ncbi:MAG TPA: glycogen synthase GlgA [Candidatus Binataceae bacterium]|nr:glycogen synthase GlgA [Candidatus Binataceae bacterium]
MANQRPPDQLLDLLLGDRPARRKPPKPVKPASSAPRKRAKPLSSAKPAKPRKPVNSRLAAKSAKLGMMAKKVKSLVDGKPQAKRPTRPAVAQSVGAANGVAPAPLETIAASPREPGAMKIAIIAAEITPWAKVGGLADVIGALPRALKQAGADPVVILPGYRSILSALNPTPVGPPLSVPFGDSVEQFNVLRADGAGVPLYLIDSPAYFGREGVYGERGTPYSDNFRRYAVFGRAAALAAAELIHPDVVHAHDWHSSMAPIVMRADPALRDRLRDALAIFTVHNLAFQGIFEAGDFALLNLDPSYFSVECLEFWGRINLMKGAIMLADGTSTVSPGYAREIANDPELGFGLEGVFRSRGDRFVGILNGVDYAEWDPAVDLMIPYCYSRSDPAGKQRCVAALRDEFHLPQDPARPLIGMVTRLTPQKGTDLLMDAMEALMQLDLQMVILGSGDPASEEFFRQAAERYADRLRIQTGFDNALAHRIQAGSDIFLMPSRFEPCGLTQMYALRYGSVPLVRATGGLRDTVVEFNPETGAGNGFRFDEYRAEALFSACARALEVFHNRAAWGRLMDNGFAADFAWPRAAREYLDWFTRLRTERAAHASA